MEQYCLSYFLLFTVVHLRFIFFNDLSIKIYQSFQTVRSSAGLTSWLGIRALLSEKGVETNCASQLAGSLPTLFQFSRRAKKKTLAITGLSLTFMPGKIMKNITL